MNTKVGGTYKPSFNNYGSQENNNRQEQNSRNDEFKKLFDKELKRTQNLDKQIQVDNKDLSLDDILCAAGTFGPRSMVISTRPNYDENIK